MDPVWLLLLLPAAAASGWIAATTMGRRSRDRHGAEIPSAYFRGLNFLLNEQTDKAIELFVQVLEVDTETVEMHLAVGNLFRRRGEIEKATRIHQNLIARPNLDHRQRAEAQFELGQDYFKAGLFDRAEQLFLDLAGESSFRDQAHRHLLQIYDQEKDWDNAIAMANKLDDAGSDMGRVVAQYHCELAEAAIAEGRYSQATTHTRDALAADADCVRATVQAGRLAALEGNHRLAIETWRRIEQQNQSHLGEVVELIANSYRALGDVEGLQAVLRDALGRQRDVRLMLALIEALESQGLAGGERAERFLIDWLRHYPTLHGLYRLIQIKLRHSRGPAAQDLKLLEGLIGDIVGKEPEYECQQCGFCGRSLHWQCPGCKGWNTMVSRRGRSVPGSRSVRTLTAPAVSSTAVAKSS